LYKDTIYILFPGAQNPMNCFFDKWLFIVLIWFFGADFYAQEKSNDSIPEHLTLYGKAAAEVDSARYKEAVVLLKKATKLKPDYWEAWNKIAYAQLQLKDHKESIKALDKAEKIAPLNFESLKMRAINYYLTGKFSECKVVLDTAVYIAMEETIEDAELHYYRALLMFKGKNYKGALDACEMTLEIDPRYVKALLLKGEVRFHNKEYKYAIRELDEAIARMPADKTDYNAFQLRAKSKFEVSDFSGAVKDWDVYIEAMGKGEEALIARGAAKININDNTGAIADLDEAIKINSKNAVSYCYRGVAKGGNKAYIEAIKDLDHSIKLKFDYPAAYVNRAAIKFASKDKRGACEDLKKADVLGSETAFKLIERYCK
jgi:tetratricopeptide (TPR) repeat protein